MIFLETFLVNLIKSQRIFAIICYYLKYLVSKFRILVHKRTILAWKLIFCSTLSTFRPKCPKTNGYNQTKNKLSLIMYFGNPKFWKCLGYNYDWLSIPPLDENLLFQTLPEENQNLFISTNWHEEKTRFWNWLLEKSKKILTNWILCAYDVKSFSWPRIQGAGQLVVHLIQCETSCNLIRKCTLNAC